MQAFKGTVGSMIEKSAARQWYAKVNVSQINIANLIFAGTVGTIVYLVLGPMIFLLWSSFRSALPTPADPGTYTFDNYVFAYTSPMTYHLFLNTIVFVAVSTSISVVVAFAFAWFIERTDIPAKKTLFMLILLPAAVPSMLMAMAYIILAGPEAGIINVIFHQLFGFKPINIFSRFWLFALNGLHGVPATFLILLGALRSMDPALEEAASVSGASRMATVRRVTLPMMLPAILAASIYTGMSAAETFELPTLIGVPIGFHVFSSQVYLSIRVWGNHTLASAYSVIFRHPGCAHIFLPARNEADVPLHNHFRERLSAQTHGDRSLEVPSFSHGRLFLLGDRRAAAAGFYRLELFSGLARTGSYRSGPAQPRQFSQRIRQRCVPRQPKKYGIHHPRNADIDGMSNQRNFLAHCPVKSRPKSQDGVGCGYILATRLSRHCAGVGLLWFFIMVDFPPVWGTLWPVIFGLTISYMPFTVRTLNAAFIQVHKELEEAAYVSGASWLATFRKILLPLVAPAMASAALWIAIHAMRSLTVPMFLSTHGNDVLAVLVWTYWESNMVESVSVIGLFYLVTCAALSLLWRHLSFREFVR